MCKVHFLKFFFTEIKSLNKLGIENLCIIQFVQLGEGPEKLSRKKFSLFIRWSDWRVKVIHWRGMSFGFFPHLSIFLGPHLQLWPMRLHSEILMNSSIFLKDVTTQKFLHALQLHCQFGLTPSYLVVSKSGIKFKTLEIEVLLELFHWLLLVS